MDNLFIREFWVYQRRGRLRGQSRRRRQRVWAATKFTSTPRWTTWRLCLLLEDDNIVPKVEKGRFSILKCNSLSASCGHYQGCLSPQTRLVCNDIYCPTSPLHIPSKYNPLPIQIQKLQWMQRTTRRESVAASASETQKTHLECNWRLCLRLKCKGGQEGGHVWVDEEDG